MAQCGAPPLFWGPQGFGVPSFPPPPKPCQALHQDLASWSGLGTEQEKRWQGLRLTVVLRRKDFRGGQGPPEGHRARASMAAGTRG